MCLVGVENLAGGRKVDREKVMRVKGRMCRY